jgi:superfamily I DNA and/or RNA helicase
MTILKQIAEDDALINYLNSVRKTDAAIGVICMYAEQKRYLQQLFNQNAWPEGFKDLVNIDTVDSYQGKKIESLSFQSHVLTNLIPWLHDYAKSN